MKTQDIPIVASGLIAKMSEDGYSKKTIEKPAANPSGCL